MSKIVKHRCLLWLYVINATLLVCHEIDSAYWREWDLFRLPGGADLFVLLHIPLIALVLWGLVKLSMRHPNRIRIGCWFSLFLGVAGMAGGLLHSWFLINGDSRFTSAVSVSLIVAFLIVSTLQVLATTYWLLTSLVREKCSSSSLE